MNSGEMTPGYEPKQAVYGANAALWGVIQCAGSRRSYTIPQINVKKPTGSEEPTREPYEITGC